MCEFPSLGEVEFAISLHKARIEHLESENAKLKSVIEDLLYQFAYAVSGPCLITGGLSTLEDGFEALGWTSPHPIPGQRCDEPECEERATCGTPIGGTGYRRTCGSHVPREER